MLSYANIRRVARDARGFTLIETLVAMVSGLVVLGAAFAILEISLHQSSRIADVAQATQLGRTAMTRIVDELRSSCLAPTFAPLQEGSAESKLIFIDAFSEKSEIGTASAEKEGHGAYKHEIVWSEAAHTLTDTVRPSTGGSSPKFTWGEPTNVLIGKEITKTGSTPIFKYYAYAVKPATGTSEASSTLEEKTPLTVPLTATAAAQAASVLISFNTAPERGLTKAEGTAKAGRSVDFASQVTLAFSAPGTEAKIEQGPCE
jgi:Tfp pilus assembly protein PilW